MKKHNKLFILIFGMLALSGCPAPIDTTNVKPTSTASSIVAIPSITPSPGGSDDSGLFNPTPSPTSTTPSNTSNTTPIPTITTTPTTLNTNIAKVLFTTISSNEGSLGSTITIKGSNFINGKAKNILFVNSVNTEITAKIINLTDNEIKFSIPDNTRSGILAGSTELSQSYQFVKVFIVNENGEKVLVNDLFKILFSSSSNSNTSSTGGGGNLIVVPSPDANVTIEFNPNAPIPVNGNVVIEVNTNAPTQNQN
jgi:hypothetical protein